MWQSFFVLVCELIRVPYGFFGGSRATEKEKKRREINPRPTVCSSILHYALCILHYA